MFKDWRINNCQNLVSRKAPDFSARKSGAKPNRQIVTVISAPALKPCAMPVSSLLKNHPTGLAPVESGLCTTPFQLVFEVVQRPASHRGKPGGFFQQAVSSTFAMFGVRRFITAFISLALIVFWEDPGDDGVVQKVRSTQKGKRQSIAALQIDGKSRG